MKRYLVFIFLVSFVLSGCSKSSTPTGSGTVTLDNILGGSSTSGYYSLGFLFSQAKKVSTVDSPGPDILVYVSAGTPPTLTIQADNLNPSFYKVGDYPDAQSASTAFSDLKTVGNYQWTEMADTVSVNQVWVFRTGTQCYAKIRIISTVNETRNSMPYGEITFEWVYQPDGSTTFPL